MTIITREDLYEKVWSQPITHIAEEYGVSDSTIIKICKKMEVPRPGAGHWTKVGCGKTVKKAKLPKLSKKGISEYRLSSHSGRVYDKCDDKTNDHPLISFEKDEINKIVVEKEITNPHNLTLKNQKSFRNSNTDDRFMLRPRAKKHCNLKVTEGTVERALNIMDALLKAFELRGWKFHIKADPELKMYIVIQDEEIEFSITEKTNRIDHVITEKEKKDKAAGRYYWAPKWDYVSSGELTLKIENSYWLISKHTWKDGKIQRIEECLNKFCISAIELSEAIKVDRVKKEEDVIRRKKEEAERYRLKELRDMELKKREIFEKQVDAWEKAEKIRKFVNEVSLSGIQTVYLDKEELNIDDWLRWANNYADLIDPLCKGKQTVVEETEEMFRW